MRLHLLMVKFFFTRANLTAFQDFSQALMKVSLEADSEPSKLSWIKFFAKIVEAEAKTFY